MEFRINIKDMLVPRIEAAVNGGDYKNASEFINLAIEDKLEGTNTSAPSIDHFIAKDGSYAQYNISSADANQTSSHSNKHLDENPNAVVKGGSYGGYKNPRAYICRLSNVKPISKNLKKPELEIFDQNTIIWGQINRFLPIKISLLIAAQEIEKSGDEYNLVGMKDLLSSVKSSARYIGEFLKGFDDEYNRKGPDKLSVGFATGNGLKLDKGLERFTSHFVLRYRKTDKAVEGALVKLGFLRVYNMNGSGFKVGMTESGVNFLNLSNPVIDLLNAGDEVFYNPNKILSEEEKSFIIKTIAELIPIDFEAMKKVLNLIDSGANTQKQIQKGLQGNKDFGGSESMIDTNKNGIIARLAALELIGRNKQSLNVEYYLTDEGKKIISKKIRSSK